MTQDWMESSAPLILVASLVFAFLAGVVTVRWGGRLPRLGEWLAGVGVLALILGLLVTKPEGIFDASEPLLHYVRGWIWPQDAAQSIRVGIAQDALGFTGALIPIVLAALVILDRILNPQDPDVRKERILGSAVLGATGVVLAWISSTTWLAFGGVLVASFAGFLALGTRWGEVEGAEVAVRYVRERSAGLILALFGAFALASSGADLSLLAGKDAAPWSGAAFWGGALLVLGLFAQTQPFPLSAWLSRSSRVPLSVQLISAQVFPALAALAPLIRLEPALRKVGVMPLLGWFALASTALVAIQGLLQKSWRSALAAWVSSAFGLVVAAIAFSGPWAAWPLGLSALIGGAGLSMIAAVPSGQAHGGRWAAWFVALCGAGVAGFVGFPGTARVIQDSLHDPALATALGFARFAVSLLIWKLVWLLPVTRKGESGHWSALIVPGLVAISGLGVFWVGTLTAGGIPGAPDQVLVSLVDRFFGASETVSGVTPLSVLWGVLILSLAIGYWSTGRGEDRWLLIGNALPRFAHYIESGYQTERVFDAFFRGTYAVADALHRWVDIQFWMRGLPRWVDVILNFTSDRFNRVEGSLSRGLHLGIHRSVHVPAKMLQLIQSGDVQWYLFFALGTGVVILLHFLRF
jgi:hypothetical protein